MKRAKNLGLNIIDLETAENLEKASDSARKQLNSFLKKTDHPTECPFPVIGGIKIPDCEYPLNNQNSSIVFRYFETDPYSEARTKDPKVSDMSRSYKVRDVSSLSAKDIIRKVPVKRFHHCSQMFCTGEYLREHKEKYPEYLNTESLLILGFQKNFSGINWFGMLFRETPAGAELMVMHQHIDTPVGEIKKIYILT